MSTGAWYIVTREGVAIPENKREIDREIFMNYLDSCPQSHGLFTGTDEKIVLDKVAKEVANHAGTMWTHIASLRREDAEKWVSTRLMCGGIWFGGTSRISPKRRKSRPKIPAGTPLFTTRKPIPTSTSWCIR